MAADWVFTCMSRGPKPPITWRALLPQCARGAVWPPQPLDAVPTKLGDGSLNLTIAWCRLRCSHLQVGSAGEWRRWPRRHCAHRATASAAGYHNGGRSTRMNDGMRGALTAHRLGSVLLPAAARYWCSDVCS
jgi:hypothetical protein